MPPIGQDKKFPDFSEFSLSTNQYPQTDHMWYVKLQKSIDSIDLVQRFFVFAIVLLYNNLWLVRKAHTSFPTNEKQPAMPCSCVFSRAWRHLQHSSLSSDSLICVFFVIG